MLRASRMFTCPLVLVGLFSLPASSRQVEITVTLQCSGTRRIEQIQEYPGDGDELINAVSPTFQVCECIGPTLII